MKTVELTINALVPTRSGCAIFLGDGEKMTQFFIESAIGLAINDHLAGEEFERPLTYDMMTSLLQSLGATMKRLLINDYQQSGEEDGIYYASMVWEMANEVEQRKIVEIDCRPSDAIALAVRQEIPILILESVWEGLEDKTPLLIDLKEQMGEDLRG